MRVLSMITNRLKELRKQRMNESDTSSDWTQEALGTRVAITRQTVISIEKGTYNPSLELAFKLAREFGLRIEDIFNYRGEHDEK